MTSDLITVPACKTCNNGSSHDDFKFMIDMGIYIGSDAPEFWQKTIKSLNRNAKRKKYKNLILDRTSVIQVPAPYGGYGHPYKADKLSIDRGVRKIVKGLSWYTRKQIILNDQVIRISMLKQGHNIAPKYQGILDLQGNSIITGGGDFKAQYLFHDGNEVDSVWKISFYNVDCFICVVHSK